jgi:TPP-dependent 2-oxoacid decarboxylase
VAVVAAGFSADLKPKKLITATNDKVNIKYHSFDKIPLETFMAQLSDKVTKRDPATLDIKRAIYGCVHKPARYIEQGEAPTKHAMQKVHTTRTLIVALSVVKSRSPKAHALCLSQGEKTTLRRFFDRVSDFIQPNSVVIAETGVSMFSVAETLLPKGCDFIGQIFYGSIGYTVGATLGVAMALKDTVCTFSNVACFLVRRSHDRARWLCVAHPGQGGGPLCGRWLVPGDRAGPVHVHSQQAQARYLPDQQRRLHDREVPSLSCCCFGTIHDSPSVVVLQGYHGPSSALQQHPALGLQSAAVRVRWR